MKNGVLSMVVLLGFLSCQRDNPDYGKEAANPEFLHRSMVRLTDVIIYDVFPPPISSRIYAYSTIAAYEALVPGFPECQSLAGQLNDLDSPPKPDAGKVYCYPLASVHAFLTVGKALTFSEDSIAAFQKELYAEFEAMNMPDDVYERSMQFGEAVAKHVLAWSGKDNYKQTRTFPKFSLDEDPARWQPTLPGIKKRLSRTGIKSGLLHLTQPPNLPRRRPLLSARIKTALFTKKRWTFMKH